jgi:hypothetical protein
LLIDLLSLADDLIDDMENEAEEVPPEDREADNADGWVDEQKEMSQAEWKALAKDMMPTRCMMLKVSTRCWSTWVNVGPLLVHVAQQHLGQGLLRWGYCTGHSEFIYLALDANYLSHSSVK